MKAMRKHKARSMDAEEAGLNIRHGWHNLRKRSWQRVWKDEVRRHGEREMGEEKACATSDRLSIHWQYEVGFERVRSIDMRR